MGVIRNHGSSLCLVACAGGNLSEERFSPRPPSKDFSQPCRPEPARLAVTAEKFLKGGVGGNSFRMCLAFPCNDTPPFPSSTAPCRLDRQGRKIDRLRGENTDLRSTAADLSSEPAKWQAPKKGHVACILPATTSACGGCGGPGCTGQHGLACQSVAPAGQARRGHGAPGMVSGRRVRESSALCARGC